MGKKKLILITIFVVIVAVFIVVIASNNSRSEIHTHPVNEPESVSIEPESPLHKTEVPDGYVGIYTVDDFDYMRNSSSGKYILMNDIDMNNVLDWQSIDFQGMFDGNNYEVYGLHSNSGFFNEVVDANITNFILDITVNEGTHDIQDTIFNPSSADVGGLSNTIKTSDSQGAFCYIGNCTIKGNITANGNTGSIAANVYPGNTLAPIKISNVINEANISISGKGDIGGIVGRAIQQNSDSNKTNIAFEVFNYINKGNITTTSKDYYNVGGILGYGMGIIERCENYGNLSVSSNIAKDGEELDSMSFLDGTYEKLNSICGGIVAVNGYCTYRYGEIEFGSGQIGDISFCSNYGTIDSEQSEYAGGIIGYTTVSYTLSNCANYADIKGTSAGGIQGGGYTLSTLSRCWNSGNIIGSTYSGALIGEFWSNAPEPQICYYLDNGLNPVGVKAKFPKVYAIEKEAIADENRIDLGGQWTFDSNGPKIAPYIKEN